MNRLFIILLGVILFFSGCSKTESTMKGKKIINIGAILPLTGNASQWGIGPKKAIDLAVEEWNIKQNKYIFKIIYQDSQADPRMGVNSIEKLTANNDIQVIIGAVSSTVTLAIAPVAEKKKIVLISPSSTSHMITNAGDYIFRTISSDIFEGYYMAKYISEKYKDIKKIVVISDDSAGTQHMAEAFMDKSKKLGNNIVDYQIISHKSINFKSTLLKIKNNNPQALYLVAFPAQLGILLKQIHELDMNNIKLFSAQPAEDPEVKKIAGKSIYNKLIYSTTTPDLENSLKTTKKFIKNYKAMYADKPMIFSYEAYDAANLAIEAIIKRGNNSEKIKNYLYGVKNYSGVSGEFSFDKNGDVTKEIRIVNNAER